MARRRWLGFRHLSAKRNRERETQRAEEIRGETEELGEGGLLLHATTARQARTNGSRGIPAMARGRWNRGRRPRRFCR